MRIHRKGHGGDLGNLDRQLVLLSEVGKHVVLAGHTAGLSCEGMVKVLTAWVFSWKEVEVCLGMSVSVSTVLGKIRGQVQPYGGPVSWRDRAPEAGTPGQGGVNTAANTWGLGHCGFASRCRGSVPGTQAWSRKQRANVT